MKQQTLSRKENSTFFSLNTVLVFSYSIVLGALPRGYILMLACMCYFFMKENEEKYVFFIGYLLGCVVQGMLYTYQQTLLISIWLCGVLLLSMLYHNPMRYTYVLAMLGISIYSIFIGISPTELFYALSIFFLVFLQLKALFFEREEVLWYIGICIILSLYLQYFPLYIDPYTILTILSFLLVLLTPILKLSTLLSLLVLTVLLYPNTSTYLYLFIPTMIFYIFRKDNKAALLHIFFLYIVVLYALQYPILYIICGGIIAFITLSINTRESIQPVLEYHPYQKSADLLRQFSSITQSLISTGSESTLIYALKDVLENNANELEQAIEYDRIPSIIKDVLEAYKYEVVDIEVQYDNALYITIKLYNTSYKDIQTTLLPILEVALHTTVYLQHYEKADLIHSYHECLLMIHPCIKVKYDSIQKASKEVCGDEINVVFRRECTTFLLSDGMGEGYQAKSQSTFAIRFISQLIQIGVPFQTMIKLINQLLLLKQRESFATLDILSIDTLTKRCLLYKSGSAQTYLIRNDTVIPFEAQSLPLGIVSKISPDVYTFEVKENDQIVMMSDGAESEYMCEWLREIKGRSPTTLVKTIYEKKEHEGIHDDLSILGVSVQKNSHF